MHQRCENPNDQDYDDYGGRGILVCDRWSGPGGLVNFISDVGRRPSPSHSIDRYPNVNGNYEPGNVRWATKKEQSLNRRNAKMLTANGVTLHLSEWAEILGCSPNVIRCRIESGWEVSLAVTKQVRPCKRKRNGLG